MKTVGSSLNTHIQGEVTTLATCWKITRTDGTAFHFTDHDVDITYDGNTYKAETGYKRTAIENNSKLAVDNLDVEGIFDSSEITEADLRAGLFDYATVRIFIVNWNDLSQGEIKMRKGWLGEVTLTRQGLFKAELRGLTQALSQRIGEVYTPECRADLGDSRCKVPIDPSVRVDSTAYVVGDFVRVVTAGSPDGTQADYENRIYECTQAGTSASSAPTFDTTVGNTTQDGYVAATGTLTLSANAADGETVVIGSQTYTFKSPFVDAANNVEVGGSASVSLDNLIAAINGAAGEGSTYGTGTATNTDVTAAAGAGDTMDVTAITAGAAANSTATTETLANGAWGATMLEGGVDGIDWVARQAWMRHGVVDTVTDRKTFTLTVGFDETRAVDDWFNGGALEFEDGDNAGRVIEVRDWAQSTRTVTLFLPTSFTIAVGAKVRLYPGCDKRSATCIAKFALAGTTDFANGNIKNFRGEPYVPGQDELMRYPDAK